MQLTSLRNVDPEHLLHGTEIRKLIATLTIDEHFSSLDIAAHKKTITDVQKFSPATAQAIANDKSKKNILKEECRGTLKEDIKVN